MPHDRRLREHCPHLFNFFALKPVCSLLITKKVNVVVARKLTQIGDHLRLPEWLKHAVVRNVEDARPLLHRVTPLGSRGHSLPSESVSCFLHSPLRAVFARRREAPRTLRHQNTLRAAA